MAGCRADVPVHAKHPAFATVTARLAAGAMATHAAASLAAALEAIEALEVEQFSAQSSDTQAGPR